MARRPRDNRPAVSLPVGLIAPSTMRAPQPQEPTRLGDADVEIQTDGPVDGVKVDPTTGATMIETDDGGVVVNFSPDKPQRKDAKFNDNLADDIDASELARISEELLLGIDQDETSRTEWLETRAHGIRLLGLKIENPKVGADSSTAVEGQSTVQHPLLLEAVLRFQANATGELLPASGPVKIADKVDESGQADVLAQALENDMNYYLTTVATEYYPDTDRMLFYVGFGGCSFKKVYNCPIRRRPVSESVDAKDLIVSDAATDLRNCKRVTHQIIMKPSTLKRMQLAGAYRDISIGTANPRNLNAVDQQISDTQGIDNPTSIFEADRDHTIYECYCELDIKGFEDKTKGGKITGLALPYRVVIDRDSRMILEVRRNWRQDDETKLAKICFVKYSFVPALGFYDVGFLHILGNTTNALTAAWREMLDNGMFANFPGFLYSKLSGRQNTNEFRIPPGGGMGVDTNGGKIQDAIMPLPYKDIGPAFANFVEQVAETGQRIGGSAEINVGEGNQEAPVGTTLAMIEQATKIESAVHKRLHASQTEEFQLLKECFRENPEAFLRAIKGTIKWTADTFLQALNDSTLAPQADPNTPSHMHRMMKAQAYVQLDKAYPQMLNSKAIVRRVIVMMGDENPDELFAPPQPAAPPDPEVMLKMAQLKQKGQDTQLRAQTDQQELQLKSKIADQDSQKDQQDLQLRQQIAQTQAASDAAADQSRMKVAAMQMIGDMAKQHSDHQHDEAMADIEMRNLGVGPQ